MSKILNKKISLTSLMFNVGFYSSYSMDKGYQQLRPVQSVNSVDDNFRPDDRQKLFETRKETIVKKGCSVKKGLLITGITTLGLIAIGTGLYFLLKDRDNNDNIIPPIPVPGTDNFTDRITEIITDNITTDIVTADSTYIDNITYITDSTYVDNITDVITTIPTTINTTIPTIINTTIPTAINTTIPTAINTTIPIAINTTIPTTINTTIPIAINTTIPIAINTTIPIAINTTIPTTIPTDINTEDTTEKPYDPYDPTDFTDECVDLSDQCSYPEMITFLKSKFDFSWMKVCFGRLQKPGLKFIFNNDTNCMMSLYEKYYMNIFEGYFFDSVVVVGTMFQTGQRLFEGINTNLLDFRNVDFSKVTNFYEFITNCQIKNVYGLNNRVFENKQLQDFIKNCNIENLNMSDLSILNSNGFYGMISNSVINNTLDMSNLKMYNIYSGLLLLNTKVNDFKLENLNITDVDYFSNNGYHGNSIELRHCFISNSNINDFFDQSNVNITDMSYCIFNSNLMNKLFHGFIGKMVDFSNVIVYSDSFSSQFENSFIDYINMTNCLYYNLVSAESMFSNGNFKVVNLTNTKADSLLNFQSAFSGSNIETIIMKNFSTKNLTNIFSVFKGTNFTATLKSIDISGWDMGNVINIQNMFENSNVEYINASFININNQSGLIHYNMFTNTYNLTEIWFDFTKYYIIRDILIDNGFTCKYFGCRRNYYNFKNITKTTVDKQKSLIRKNNKNLRDDKFIYNENIIDKDKFNITVEGVDVSLNPETGRDNMFIKFKLAINDYLINPLMKFFRLR